MKCPYGMQRWNHFLKQQQNKAKQNQYKLHLIQFVKKKKDNPESGFILINDLY